MFRNSKFEIRNVRVDFLVQSLKTKRKKSSLNGLKNSLKFQPDFNLFSSNKVNLKANTNFVGQFPVYVNDLFGQVKGFSSKENLSKKVSCSFLK